MTKREYLSKRGIISMLPAWVAEEEADEAFKASVDNLAEHYDTIWTEDEGVTYAPVRHGKWLGGDDSWLLVCSECSVKVDKENAIYGEGELNYCPNCGAKMDNASRQAETCRGIKGVSKIDKATAEWLKRIMQSEGIPVELISDGDEGNDDE